MKVMFIVYHDLRTEARSQEILETAKRLGQAILVSYSKPNETRNYESIITGKGKKHYFAFIRDAIKAIRLEKPEIVILHDNYTAILLYLLKRFRKETFVIYDSSELYIDQKYNSVKMKIASHMAYLEKKYLKYANIVVAANIERARIMKEFFKLDDIPIVFDNIHKIDDCYDEKLCNEKYGQLFQDDTFCIVYGGGIAERRFTFELTEAVGNLGNNYRLVVVGAATAENINKFNIMLKEKNIFNVTYIGFIPRNEWRYLLHKANISVSAFTQDTVNNKNCASGKIYESLFEGTPILTSENPPLKRICTEYGVGVSDNNFYKGIKELEKNYEYYCKKVKDYTNTIDLEKRIDLFANTLKERINTYKGE
jgi:hypothetical protein